MTLDRPPALAPSEAVDRLRIDEDAVRDFCARHGVKTLYLFGSALTGGFNVDSDVDLMFETEGPSPSYLQQMSMTDELALIFGRRVDLVSRRAVEESTNGIRRESILGTARVIHSKPALRV
jgi:predicted nucleotidyltransferase